MCLQPFTIRHTHRVGFISGARVVHVPCGHCYECIRKRKLDWEIRLHYEMLASDKTYFSLITYNEMFYHSDVDYHELKLFLTLVRQTLKRKYNTTMKYFLVSEYGERRDRLHYHCLFFLKGWTLGSLEFQALLESCWVERIPRDPGLYHKEQKEYRRLMYHYKKGRLKQWPLPPLKYDYVSRGFCTAQIPKGSGMGSIQYACEYIQKSYNKMFYSRCGFDEWLSREILQNRLIFEQDSVSGHYLCFPHYYRNNNFYNNEYPKVKIRGRAFNVPRSWIDKVCGKHIGSYYKRVTYLKRYDSTYNKSKDIALLNKIENFNRNESDLVNKYLLKSLEMDAERPLRYKWLSTPFNYSEIDFENEFRSQNKFGHSRSNPVQVELPQLFHCEDELPLSGSLQRSDPG